MRRYKYSNLHKGGAPGDHTQFTMPPRGGSHKSYDTKPEPTQPEPAPRLADIFGGPNNSQPPMQQQPMGQHQLAQMFQQQQMAQAMPQVPQAMPQAMPQGMNPQMQQRLQQMGMGHLVGGSKRRHRDVPSELDGGSTENFFLARK